MENKELMEILVKAIFAVMSVLITGYLIPWLKSNVQAEKMDAFMVFVEKCVQSAEKLYTPEEWKEKKQYVLDLATEEIKKLGIELSSATVEAIIEGFVKEIKG